MGNFTRWVFVFVLLSGCDGSGVTPDAGGSDAAVADAGPSGPVDVTVDIAEGAVVGMLEGGIHTFWNVPYAESPEGSARWTPPVAHAAWTEPFDATERGPACSQVGLSDYRGVEDCLGLNVWTPELSPESPLPVMVWIHGGAFAIGSGRDRIYDAQHLAAAGPVVVVTINYRIGELGYFAHPALTAEAGGTSGNYALLDQIEALRWVQRNIGRFGGDASNVTIFGESAGGHSVCQLLVSPPARGLFHAAISQSGVCATPLLTLAEAEARGETVAALHGCDGADPLPCLRALPPEVIQPRIETRAELGGLFYQGDLWAFPIIDGTNLPDRIHTLMRAGAHDASLPVIIGSNTDEAELFQNELVADPVTNEADYRATLARFWGDANADLIAAEYAVADFESANQALTIATTDGFFTCPARQTSRALSDAGNPTWRYVFAGIPNLAPLPGAFHAAELLFVWGNAAPGYGAPEGRSRVIVPVMQGYWTRFAANGDPNGAGAVSWPAYETSGDRHLLIDREQTEGSGYLSARCDFWDGILDAL